MNCGNRRMLGVRELLCRGGCGQPESLVHILQKCQVTHETKCARHNQVVRFLSAKFTKAGYEVLVEPIIPVHGSFRKPDLVVRSGATVYVVDVSVISGISFDSAWGTKVSHYNTRDVHDGIHAMFGEGVIIKHVPFLISYRGLVCQRSTALWRTPVLSRRDVMDISLLVVRGALKGYDVYTQGT